MFAGGWWRQANLNVGRTSAGAAGTQLAAITFGGAATYPTALNSTEIFNGLSWSYGNNLNTGRSNGASAGSATAGLFFGGISGTSYLNASESFNGTVWTAGSSLNYARDENIGGGSTLAAWTTGGYNGTSTLNITEKYNGTLWTSSGSLATARRNAAGAGTQSSAWASAGGGNLTSTEVFDGGVWASRGNNNQGRQGPAGLGDSASSGLMTGGNDGSNSLRSELFDGNVWTTTSPMQTYSGNSNTFRMAGSGSVTGGGLVAGGDTGGGTGTVGTAGWFVALQSYSWMTMPPTSANRYRHGQAGGSNQDMIVFGGYNLVSTTEKWSGTAWATSGSLSQGKNDPTGTGESTTALCIGGNNSGYLTRTESFNGSIWSTLAAVLNTARDQLASAGNSSAALGFGGYTGSASLVTESFNGSAWSNVNNLQNARYALSGCGSQAAAISAGGAGPLKRTELWNGSVWANSGDLNTANSSTSLSGSSTSARIANGVSYNQTSELWTGSSWTSSLVPNIARQQMGNGPGGVSTGMVVAGGTTSGSWYPSEIYVGAVPVVIDLTGIPLSGTGSDFIQQSFPPPGIGTGSLLADGKYIGPFFDETYDGQYHRGIGGLLSESGIMAPFNFIGIPFSGIGSLSATVHVTSVINVILPLLQMSATMERRSGILRAYLPMLQFSATMISGGVGRITGRLPVIQLAASGKTGGIGSLSATLPALILSASGYDLITGSILVTLPGLRMVAHARLDAPLYRAIAMNPKILAMSDYENFPFNSFAFFNGVYLGAKSTGIHKLEGGDDAGANIDAEVKLGKIPLELNKVRDVWVQGEATGGIRVSVSADEGMDSFFEEDYLLAVLGQDRATIPRGLKPVYIQVGVFNEEGADFTIDAIQLIGENIQRKKR